VTRVHTAGIAAEVTKPDARLTPVGEHPGDPVGLVELAVETDDPVSGEVAAAGPLPAAVAWIALDFGPEGKDAVDDLPPGSHCVPSGVRCIR